MIESLIVMVIAQRKFREIVFQVLFSRDLNEQVEGEMVISFLDQLMISKKNLIKAYHQVNDVMDQLEKIDMLISKFSKEYDFERISRVERNVLRLGVYELWFSGVVSPKIVISEAIRITRKFGTPEGGAFVNAILDAVYHLKEDTSK